MILRIIQEMDRRMLDTQGSTHPLGHVFTCPSADMLHVPATVRCHGVRGGLSDLWAGHIGPRTLPLANGERLIL